MVQLVILLLAALPRLDVPPDEAVRLGAAIVCAEARGESPAEQMAIGAVVRNRVDLGIGGDDPVEVMLAPRQFAEPCDAADVRPSHATAFLRGYTRTHWLPWLSSDVVGFCTPAAAARVGRRWERRWDRVRAPGMAHVFWRVPK